MGKKQNQTNQTKEIKKYKSAYMFFTQENAQKYKIMYPNLLFREIFKIIGADWKNLKASSKKKYYDLEKQSKEIFEKNKEKSVYKYTKKKIKIKKPIKKRTPFMLYLRENKDKVDKDNCIESLKKIGELWKSIANDEKEEYIQKAKDDEVRYQKELFEFLKNKDKIKKKIKKKK